MDINVLKQKHNDKIEILKLKGEQKIEENKIRNDLTLQNSEFESSQLTIKEKIRLLKMANSKDRDTIRSGKLLLLWGFIATIVSSVLTIAGLYRFFADSTLKLVSFVLVILLAQFSVYVLSKHITNIKTNFKQHYIKAEMLRVLLLIASVSGNFIFFTANSHNTIFSSIITLILCICIDLIAIYCSSIGEDFKRLNKKIPVQNSNIENPVQTSDSSDEEIENPVQSIDEIKEKLKKSSLNIKTRTLHPVLRDLLKLHSLEGLT